MNSLWEETAELPHFQRLEGNHKADILIIGGGMAGLLCAYMLQQAGMNYLLVEADTICSSVTGNTTAKITFQHGLIYNRLIYEFGLEKAQMYLQANKAAFMEYEKMCKHISCDYEVKDSFVYSVNNRKKLEKELEALEKIGYPAEYAERLPLPMSTVGAVKFEKQAQFHPLKFAASVAQGLNIYEHTQVTELGPGFAVTDSGKITAESMIVATHYPMNNKHGAFFLKIYQSRSYVIALENAQNTGGMYVDEADRGKSFRNYKNLLLLGGGSHRTGKKGGNWQELSEFARENYPAANEKYRFATQDCITLDKVPYIGRYGKHAKGLYVTAGFNKWGMTSSMVSAILLRDMILEKRNEYEEVFCPQRTILRPQLFCNMGESTVNILSYSKRRCPHMGCALRWNRAEQSWDCPCHGSRFSKDGELLENPATGNLK